VNESEATSAIEKRGPQGTLLVVDDERENLDSLERIFSREGYKTLLASSAQAAWPPRLKSC